MKQKNPDSSLPIRLDHHSGEPIYRQIVEQVKYAIAAGSLDDDARLPTIRALAETLSINPRTVVKAYEELEHGGLVVMRHGQGVFVAPKHGAAPAAVRKEILTELAQRLLAEGARLGADADEVMAIVERVARQMEALK